MARRGLVWPAAALFLLSPAPLRPQEDDTPLLKPQAAEENKAEEKAGTSQGAALKEQGEELQRKARLLREAADKKYAEAGRLRRQAGGYRAEASSRSQALLGRARKGADTAQFLGSMFSILSQASGGTAAMSSPDTSLAVGLTSGMLQKDQASAGSALAGAEAEGGNLQMEAEKQAGPLEQRAQQLEADADRLLEAHNKLQSIANAKLLLAASEELRLKVQEDSRYVARMRERMRRRFGDSATP